MPLSKGLRLSLILAVAAPGLRAAGPVPAPAQLPAPLPSPAPKPTATQMHFEADVTSADFNTHESVMTGNARMTDGDLVMTAEEIRYAPATGLAIASGSVVLTYQSERLLADRIEYKASDGSFSAIHIRAGNYPYYVEGASADGTVKELVIHDAVISYREPGDWQPNVRARSVIYSPGHYLRVGNGKAGLGTTRPLPLFRYREDLTKATGESFMSVDAGYRGGLGPYADVALNLPVADGTSAGPDVGFYVRRGLMLGPIANYDIEAGEDKISGYLKSGWIHDFGQRDNDVLGNPVPENRDFAEWRHHEEIGGNLTIDGDLNYWKDSDIIRDFNPRAFVAVQQPDNFLETVYSGREYFVSGFVRFQPNPYFPVQQRLPEFRYDLGPTALGGGIYQRFDIDFAHLKELPPLAGPDLEANRFDTFYGLSRPFTAGNWLSFTPVAGARFTDYSSTLGAQEPGGTGRTVGELGFDAQIRTSGTFDYKNPAWQIDGLRHLLTPIFSYRYIPDANKAAQYIPPIDRSTFSTDLPILDLGDMRAIDQLQAVNVLRVGLDNALQTRDPTYGSRDLLTFDVADDFRFHPAAGQTDTSDVHADLSLMPAPWLEYSIGDSFASRSFAQKEFNSNLTLRDADLWSFSFGIGYLTDSYGTFTLPGLGSYPIRGLDSYHVETRVRINEIYQAFARVDYDDRAHLFSDQFYGVYQRLANTWIVQYALAIYGGPSREHGIGFTVSAQLVRF